jgi:hypothetical protein
MIAAGDRYASRPDLLLAEHPHREYEKPYWIERVKRLSTTSGLDPRVPQILCLCAALEKGIEKALPWPGSRGGVDAAND